VALVVVVLVPVPETVAQQALPEARAGLLLLLLMPMPSALILPLGVAC